MDGYDRFSNWLLCDDLLRPVDAVINAKVLEGKFPDFRKGKELSGILAKGNIKDVPDSIRFTKAKNRQWEEIKIHSLDTEIFDSISEFINDIEEDIRKTNVDFINSWLMKMIKEYGVKEEEIKDRVTIYTMEMNILHQAHHVFIDGHYAFSFKQGCDFSENGQSYTSWVKPEYIAEMSGGII